jgi:hypothetical protein
MSHLPEVPEARGLPRPLATWHVPPPNTHIAPRATQYASTMGCCGSEATQKEHNPPPALPPGTVNRPCTGVCGCPVHCTCTCVYVCAVHLHTPHALRHVERHQIKRCNKHSHTHTRSITHSVSHSVAGTARAWLLVVLPTHQRAGRAGGECVAAGPIPPCCPAGCHTEAFQSRS